MHRVREPLLSVKRYVTNYDSGDISIRSKVKHDEWQKQLKCKLLCLNGADDLHYNFIKITDSISFQKNETLW